MKKQNLFYFLTLGSVFVLSGCVARTYSITKERVDQDLSTGNRGFIQGKAPAGTAEHSATRDIRVFEVELGKPYQAKQVNAQSSSQPQMPIVSAESVNKEPAMETSAVEPAVTSGPSQKYTVGKNDTLQKISKKFYGTTKKWMKIYRANKDVLKTPDKLYSGQVLTIPDVTEEANLPAQALNEPKQNLK